MRHKPKNLLDILSLDQVLGTIPSGLFLVDREQRIVYWNAEAERITGYPASEAIGQHCSFLAGIPCGRVCGLYTDSIPKPIIGIPCSVRTRAGRRIVLTKNVDTLKDEAGAVVGGVESFVDITRRVRLEERLRRQAQTLEREVRRRTAELEAEQNRLRTVLDAMSDLAYITSAEFRVEFMNRAMVEVLGQHVGETCYGIYGREDVCPWCPLPQVLAEREVREERFLEMNGRTYEIMHTPLTDADGRVHKLSVFRDITERKESEEKLRQANEDLDAFVYTVSHDLRTPLTPIIGFAEFLKEQYGERLDERGVDIIEEIERQGERMLALMEDLLAIARVGRVAPSTCVINPKGVVEEVRNEFREMVDRDGVLIEVGELPPGPLPKTLLSQIFTNLLGNALRYAGGPGARIEIGGGREGGHVRYYVRDHGPGIPGEERSRIFDLFYRGSTAGDAPGTGLGLAIVRKVARLYGGRAGVEETPGGGSTFWVEFPLAQG